MLRKVICLLGLLPLIFPAIGLSEKMIRVAVVPFAVHSQEDLSYLSQGLQEMVGDQLRQQGFETASPAEMSQVLGETAPAGADESQAREIGRRLNVDFVILGSLTKLGQTLSLDLKIVDPLAVKKTAVLFVQGEGLENLAGLADKMAQEVTARISGRQKIAKIDISGNQRIEADAIKTVLHSREGDLFSEARVSADLKRIYAMNFFEDVKVDVEDAPGGKIVHFIVEEKPSIQRIEFSGNRMIEDDNLLAVLGYTLYSILETGKLAESVDHLKELYKEKGYYRSEISYKTEEIGPKRIGVVYNIHEGDRVYIKRIEFLGNEAFSDGDLKDEIETKKKGWLSWLFDSGILKRDQLNNDLSKVVEFYHNHGYIKARVGDPEVKVEEDGLVVTIPVEEGSQFKVGKITFSGDKIVTDEKLDETVQINKEKIFNREVIRKDVQTLTSLYADQGYAFAAVTPMVKENTEDLTVDIDFKMEKKKLVYFERISIVGNNKSRDKVIRRELKVKEGDLFSAEGLRKSHMNLQRLGYFEEINIVHSEGSEDHLMNLKVEVKERPTGAFSVGAGYSSFNKLFGLVRVSQNNLFGKGQQLSVEGSFGSRINEYSLSFTEPWYNDTPLSVGFDIYNRTTDYDDYDKDSIGLVLRAGYPIKEFVRLSGRYLYEEIEVYNITPWASYYIKEISGQSSTSSLAAMIRRDTRNRYFNPTEGSDNSFTVEYAGGFLGGSNFFNRYILDSGWFFPMPWREHAIFARGKMGLVTKREGGDLPAYEKFYLGGLNSLRGYEWGSISPVDPATGTRIGGEKMALINLEYIFPIIKDAGLVGVVFYDQGNVWSDDENWDFGNLRKSYGGGFRYYSPLGPMRLEYGRVIDPQVGESEGNWEFSIGTFF